MWRYLSRTLVVLLACLFSVVGIGCASNPSAHFVVFEGISGKTERIPFQLEGTADSAIDIMLHGVAAIDQPIVRGYSGAPCIDSSGNVIGFVAASLHQSAASRHFGIRPKEEVYSVLAHGRTQSNRHERWEEGLAIPADVVPGKTVAVVDVWGDMELAGSGILAIRQGNEAVIFGHKITRRGPMTAALFTASPIAISKTGHEFHRLAQLDDLIGSVIWDENGGVYCVLGKIPPILSLDVSFAPKHYRSLGMSCEIVLDSSSLPRSLSAVLQQSVGQWAIYEQGAKAHLKVTVGGKLVIEKQTRDWGSGLARVLTGELIKALQAVGGKFRKTSASIQIEILQ